MSLSPFPDGWYYLASSVELKPGQVLTRRLAGEDVVLFRTHEGRVTAVEPHCPHLGAHLGHGGRVEGEELRCPMHGFCFDTSGRCVRTPYGKRPPPGARLHPRPLLERHGVVLVWHSSEGRAPSWEVPDVSTTGFSSLRTTTIEMAGHPQETSENSVDLGHLSTVHAFLDVEMTGPLSIDGPHLSASFSFKRGAGHLGRLAALQVSYTAHVWGLGCSIVNVRVPGLGLRLHQYVFATPTDAGRLALTLGVRSANDGPGAGPPLMRLIPERPRLELVSALLLLAYREEVGRDVAIWERKKFLASPALADGDGPIGRYRKWARQFYSPAPQSSRAPSEQDNEAVA